MNQLMPKSTNWNKMGISFIEILITLLILGLITTFVIPSFYNKQRNSPKAKFIAQFTELMQKSLTQAIITQKIHQIFFDLENKLITVKIHNPALKEQSEHNKFSPVPPHSFPQPMHISPALAIRNFFINGIDDVQGGNDRKTIWFYIMPDGTSQSIIINIEDIETTSEQNKFAITVNPFYSQVKEHDTFQKP